MNTTAFYIGPDSAPDRYRLLRSIGRGGEAVLYLAEIELAGGIEPVVVKVLDAKTTMTPEAFERISQRWNDQAELLRFAHRPGVVGVREHFQGPAIHRPGGSGALGGRALALVMNHVDGLDLRDWRAERTLATPGERREVMRTLEQLADVLDWLHSGHATPSGRTVVHGDLSPGNVMVDGHGQATLVDFGLSKLGADHRTAEVWFTRGYAAPEVFAGKRTPATDRYAFGALAYFLLSGQSPPAAPGQLADALGTLPQVADLPPEQRGRIPTIASTDPGKRPSSLSSWVKDVRHAVVSTTTTSRTETLQDALPGPTPPIPATTAASEPAPPPRPIRPPRPFVSPPPYRTPPPAIPAIDPRSPSAPASPTASPGPGRHHHPSPSSNVTGHNINVVQGAKGNFALRDVVVNRIHNTRNSNLAILAIALIAFLALATYGGTRILTDDTPAGRGPSPLNDPALVKAILPEAVDMPSGWTLSEAAKVEPSCPECAAGVRYTGPTSTGPASLRFSVTAHATAADAKDRFDESGLLTNPSQLDMPAIGDQRVGTKNLSPGEIPGSIIIVVRVGTLELTVQEFKASSAVVDDDILTVEELARMFTDRAEQARNGQTPTAQSGPGALAQTPGDN